MIGLMFLFSQVAFGETGLVVRLQMDDTSVFEQIEEELPVVKIQFGTPTGQLTELMLNDQGRTPDVNASDGIFAGATMLSPDTLTVAVVIGDTQYEAGNFELVNDGSPKDLDIQQQEKGFSLQLSTGTGHQTTDGSTEPPSEGSDGNQEQRLVDGMLSVAEDIATGNQPLPPISEETTATPNISSTVSSTVSSQGTASSTNVSQTPKNNTQSQSFPLLPFAGILFIFSAFVLFVLQRIQTLQVHLKGIERLKTYLRLGDFDVDLTQHPRIFASAETYTDSASHIIKTLLESRPVLICGNIPNLTLYSGICYTGHHSDVMQIGDQLEQLQKRHADLCLCIVLPDDQNYSDMIDALPPNTDMLWITQNNSQARLEIYQDSSWKIREIQTTQTNENGAEES